MQVYLDFFRYGAPTHGGFGLGIARTLAKTLRFTQRKGRDFHFPRSQPFDALTDKNRKKALPCFSFFCSI